MWIKNRSFLFGSAFFSILHFHICYSSICSLLNNVNDNNFNMNIQNARKMNSCVGYELIAFFSFSFYEMEMEMAIAFYSYNKYHSRMHAKAQMLRTIPSCGFTTVRSMMYRERVLQHVCVCVCVQYSYVFDDNRPLQAKIFYYQQCSVVRAVSTVSFEFPIKNCRCEKGRFPSFRTWSIQLLVSLLEMCFEPYYFRCSCFWCPCWLRASFR